MEKKENQYKNIININSLTYLYTQYFWRSITKKMKYIIRMFSNFCDSTHCKKSYEICFSKTIENIYGNDKDIYITDDDDYTHIIILNTAMPIIPQHIPKENVIGFALEPIPFLGLTEIFVKYAEQKIHRYYLGETLKINGLNSHPFVGGNSYLTYTPLPIGFIPNIPRKNTQIMSLMVSEKRTSTGHIYRHILTDAILKTTNLPIDIYGRGCFLHNPNGDDPRVRGSFGSNHEMTMNYHFHICIENFRLPHYFSEKIIDPLLCGTTPVYLGCQNIDAFFPNSVIHLTGNIEDDIKILTNICKNPLKYKKTIETEKVENFINPLKHLDEIFCIKNE